MPESPRGVATGPHGAGSAPRAPSGGADLDPAAAAPTEPLDLPAPFGKYYLTEKLATGGMAELYLAKLVGPGGFEKQLVIKQIHPRLSGQRHFVDLFVAEAKTLVTLAHGNIVPVYELGVIDDTYFIAMEYIDGPTLYRLTETLRRRGVRMAPAVAAWITARILEGLDYAHRKGDGVIHRDLSPRNVILSRDGEVKLVDFGIAVTLGAGGDDADRQSAPTGSFPYMSPEQVRKQPLTVQTDLFSVGVLLWEMLSGQRLFARSDPDATLHAVLSGDIARPSIVNPDVAARLDEVVLRALERDTAARWATAADMLAALQRYLYSLDETPGPRDLAALVARHCPPETRRYPTHHDEPADPDAPSTRPRALTTGPITSGEPRAAGPLTAVIPRDAASPRGKRPPRARTETFATHVELEHLLERAASPSTTDGDAPPGESTTPPGGAPTDASSADSSPADASGYASGADVTLRTRPDVPGRAPPSRGLLVLAALGTMGLGAASIVVFLRGRESIERSDPDHGNRAVSSARPPSTDTSLPAAAVRPNAASGSSDLAPPNPAAPDSASSAPSVSPTNAAPSTDSRAPSTDSRAPSADSRAPQLPTNSRAPSSPRPARSPHAAAVPAASHAAGTATLTIGAIPWGTVLLDGAAVGRTPIDRLSVPAGHHVVSVTFSGDDPPRTQSYTVDLGTGETRNLVADFTHP